MVSLSDSPALLTMAMPVCRSRLCREQAELQQRVIPHDDVPWCLPGSDKSSSEQPRESTTIVPLQRIGGLDVSFFSSNDEGTGASETSSRCGLPTAVAAAHLATPSTIDCHQADEHEGLMLDCAHQR